MEMKRKAPYVSPDLKIQQKESKYGPQLLSTFPVDIWVEILKFSASDVSLLLTLSIVCKDFNRLLKESLFPFLKKQIGTFDFKITYIQLVRLLKYKPNFDFFCFGVDENIFKWLSLMTGVNKICNFTQAGEINIASSDSMIHLKTSLCAMGPAKTIVIPYISRVTKKRTNFGQIFFIGLKETSPTYAIVNMEVKFIHDKMQSCTAPATLPLRNKPIFGSFLNLKSSVQHQILPESFTTNEFREKLRKNMIRFVFSPNLICFYNERNNELNHIVVSDIIFPNVKFHITWSDDFYRFLGLYKKAPISVGVNTDVTIYDDGMVGTKHHIVFFVGDDFIQLT